MNKSNWILGAIFILSLPISKIFSQQNINLNSLSVGSNLALSNIEEAQAANLVLEAKDLGSVSNESDIDVIASVSGLLAPSDYDEVLGATIYCCENYLNWIVKLDDQMLELDDGSLWIIFQQDAFIASQWFIDGKIRAKRMNDLGNYFLTYYNSTSGECERVRAICIKG